MDPAGLLLSIAAVSGTIDKVQETYNAAPAILAQIKSQIRLLENGLQQIEKWLHYTDPTSKAQVMQGLQDAIETVYESILRLQADLDSTTRTGPKTTKLLGRTASDQWVKTKFAFNDAHLKKHLTDVRECVSLVHFILSVCQLPVGQNVAREVKELGVGARALSRAHTSRVRERHGLLREQRPEQSQKPSADFNAFFESILDAEDDFLADSASEDTLTRQPSWKSYDDTPTYDRDELYLPAQNGISAFSGPSPSSDQPHHFNSRYRAGPYNGGLPSRSATISDYNTNNRQYSHYNTGSQKPPKTVQSRSPSSSAQIQRQISRKPVKRLSLSAASVLTEATLDTVTGTEGEGTAGPSDTGNLFNQASRSLNCLAEHLGNVENGETMESPPPYVNTAANPPLGDIKRRDTQSTVGSSREPTDLIQVVRDGRIDLLHRMLERGVGIDEVDPATRRTAIMEAVRLRRTKLSAILIRHGSRLHLKDIDGNTALHFAAINGDADQCVWLLSAGAQLNEYNRSGETPLDLGARAGHTEAVICLLNTWTAQNGHAVTLLRGFLEASASGNASTAQAFIERGIKPSKIEEPWKPIAYAVQSGSIPMIDLMLAHKCSLKERNADGWTALHFAAQAGHTSVVEKLLSWKQLSWKAQTKKLQETALHLAALGGHTSTALVLALHKDSNISMKDADDHQAIHHAVRNGDVQLTTTLLNRGAKLDARTKYGWTPIHIAAAYGHLPLVAEFIVRGMNLDEKLEHPSFRPSRKTNEAARKGYWCEIRWPHPSARPLHLALEFGHDDVAQTLICSGAKFDEEDSKGWRALHYASFNCRPQMVEFLLGRGASPHNITNDGNTPLRLGFREPGSTASLEDKERVYSYLQGAINAHKKSKLKQLASIRGVGANKSREVERRNKIWHLAELAAALYQSGQLGDDESELGSQLTPSISSQYNEDDDEQNDELYGAHPSSSRLRKAVTD